LNFLKRFFSSKLFLVTSLSGISTLVRVVTNLIGAKLIALYAGTVGMALLGQLTNVSSIFLNISTGFAGTGAVQLLAQEKTNIPAQKQTIVALLQLTLIYSLVTASLLIFGNYWIGNYIFSASTYNSVILIFGFTIVFYALNAQFISILNGLQEYKLLVWINIVTSLMSLAFNIVMVIEFQAYGVLLSYVTAQSIVFFYTFYVLRQRGVLNVSIDDLITTLHWDKIKQLSALSLMSITSSIAVPVTQILVRSAITKRLTLEQTGIWEATNRISAMYLMLVTSSLAIYYLPKIASLTTKSEIQTEVRKTFVFITPILLITTTAIFFARPFIVLLLFTPQFNPMQDLISVQLIGDCLKMFAWVLGYLMMGRGLVKAFIFSEVFLNVSYFLLVVWGLNTFGLVGSIYAYVINYAIAIFLYTFFCRKLLF
jgi:O-antigen/teichoic acid export membrane protein